jgi:hypothetical protein
MLTPRTTEGIIEQEFCLRARRVESSQLSTFFQDPREDTRRLLFLARLTRLTELAAGWDCGGNESLRSLPDHALYSIYRDCVRVGLKPVAQAILERASVSER